MSALRGVRPAPIKVDFGRVIEVGFRLLGWCAVTGLATAGLFVVIFAAFGNFTLDGFFLQLANLADRYGTANALRRAAFHDELTFVIGIVACAIMFFRRTSLLRVFLDGGQHGN